MIKYQINGRTERMTFKEMHSVGQTHSHLQYAYGELPQFKRPWQRFVYARHREFTLRELCEIVSQTREEVDRFIVTNKLRAPRSNWTRQQDNIIMVMTINAGAEMIGKTYEEVRNRKRYLRSLRAK